MEGSLFWCPIYIARFIICFIVAVPVCTVKLVSLCSKGLPETFLVLVLVLGFSMAENQPLEKKNHYISQ